MANHVRRQLRDAVVTLLTGLATSGSNVFASRTHELQDAMLPGLRIYTNNEAVEGLEGESTGDEQRTIELVVECCSKKSSGMDNEIDDMLKQVEAVLAVNQVAAGAQYIQLRATEIEMEGEAEKEIGVAKMTWDVVYYTQRGAPDVAL